MRNLTQPVRAAAVRSTSSDPNAQPTWRQCARSWPNAYCNVVALLWGVVSFVLFVSTVSLVSSHNVTVRLKAQAPLGCPLPSSKRTNQSNYIVVPQAAVAADEARCSQIGADVLSENGTAVDAAVATALCLGVLHPHSSGVGGGCFILIYNATTGEAEVIDARETAPASAQVDMYVAAPSSAVNGGASVAVPGELAGLYLAWQRHGKLPWSRLVTPAAVLADGFAVGQQLAVAIAANRADIAKNAALSAYLMPRGVPLQQGEMAANRALAATLRAVGTAGPRAAFYTGARAASLAADIRAAGGNVTAADLAGYVPVIRAPLRADTELGVTLIGAPPPSSGGLGLIFLANFIGGYALPWAGAGELRWHRLVEVRTRYGYSGTLALCSPRYPFHQGFKHSFAARMALGDPMDPFVRNNSAAIASLMSPAFADSMRAQTRDNATQAAVRYGGALNPLRNGSGVLPDDRGTTHLSVVDAQRNAVSLTSTINTGFGAKVLSPSSGVLLNNEMDDFSIPGRPNSYGLAPSQANFIKPGKRPLSSMSPTVVLQDGKLRAVLGASGGPRIITATAQALLRVLALGADAGSAVAAARLHHQLLPEVAWAETMVAPDGSRVAVPMETILALRQRNHTVNTTDNGAVVQMIHVHPDTGMLHAVSDLRKGGRPAGY